MEKEKIGRKQWTKKGKETNQKRYKMKAFQKPFKYIFFSLVAAAAAANSRVFAPGAVITITVGNSTRVSAPTDWRWHWRRACRWRGSRTWACQQYEVSLTRGLFPPPLHSTVVHPGQFAVAPAKETTATFLCVLSYNCHLSCRVRRKKLLPCLYWLSLSSALCAL